MKIYPTEQQYESDPYHQLIAINYKQVKPSRYLSAIQLVFEGGIETELFGTAGSADEELKTI